MDTLELRVTGMDCGACEKRIATALGRVDGVRKVDADHRTGAVRVGLSAVSVDRAVVVEWLEAAGFAVTAGEEEPNR